MVMEDGPMKGAVDAEKGFKSSLRRASSNSLRPDARLIFFINALKSLNF